MFATFQNVSHTQQHSHDTTQTIISVMLRHTYQIPPWDLVALGDLGHNGCSPNTHTLTAYSGHRTRAQNSTLTSDICQSKLKRARLFKKWQGLNWEDSLDSLRRTNSLDSEILKIQAHCLKCDRAHPHSVALVTLLDFTIWFSWDNIIMSRLETE